MRFAGYVAWVVLPRAASVQAACAAFDITIRDLLKACAQSQYHLSQE